jgi:hypothetical protein
MIKRQKLRYASSMRTVPLSTTISAEVKAAATSYCRKHGLKLSYLIERALVEQLEDEMDREAYYARRDEPTVSLERVVAERKRGKSRS